MNGLRQNIQRELARGPIERGEAPIRGMPGAEPVVAVTAPESPAATMQLMEEVCERENLVRAWQRVRENKGAPGVPMARDPKSGAAIRRRGISRFGSATRSRLNPSCT